jgi:hypothetical protein
MSPGKFGACTAVDDFGCGILLEGSAALHELPIQVYRDRASLSLPDGFRSWFLKHSSAPCRVSKVAPIFVQSSVAQYPFGADEKSNGRSVAFQ